MSDDLRYPIGKFSFPEEVTAEHWNDWLKTIASTPETLRNAVTGLEPAQLDTAYREGGWSIRQVVHHLPDSHMNSYIRFKLTLTEAEPVVKPYLEARWAELADSSAPIEPSLSILDALHTRWMIVIRSLDAEQRQRCFQHPESGRKVTLERNVALYAWHGRHHIQQILNLRQRKNW